MLNYLFENVFDFDCISRTLGFLRATLNTIGENCLCVALVIIISCCSVLMVCCLVGIE